MDTTQPSNDRFFTNTCYNTSTTLHTLLYLDIFEFYINFNTLYRLITTGSLNCRASQYMLFGPDYAV